MEGIPLQITEEVFIGEQYPVFVIAEIGQNHQGDISIAKNLICAAKESGADCVKFQKSDLEEKFTDAALNRKYHSLHSWGDTYGQHKQHLEFSYNQFRELQQFAQELGILFTASGMDPVSVEFLDSINVPFIKIGSGDADNLILIKKAANIHRPLFISTGMQDMCGVQRIYETVTQVHSRLVLLHCVSAYPTAAEDVNLRVIPEFRRAYPDINIGYSGHELGTAISVAAVALGAKVVERHLTLDKQWKGSDHSCSLEPAEFRRMVHDIRCVEVGLGSAVKRFLPCEQTCHRKLGKSVVAARDLARGTVLDEESVKVKVSEPPAVSCRHLHSLLGHKLLRSVRRDEPITLADV